MIDRNKIVGIVRDVSYKKAADTTPSLLSKYKVKPGRACRINRVVIRNRTKNSDSFTLYVENRGSIIPVAYQADPTQTTIYTITKPIWLMEGDRLRVDYTGAASGNHIDMIIFGTEHVFNDVLEFRGTGDTTGKE